MTALPRHTIAGFVLAAAIPVVALLPIGQAQAATKRISVRSTSFSPSAVLLVLGSSVQYKNDTGSPVLLRSATSNWAFTEALPPGALSEVHKPAVHGTFRATATGAGVDSAGVVYIVKPGASPGPTATSTPGRTATPGPGPSRTTSTSPPPGATTGASPRPSGGPTSGPTIGPGLSTPAPADPTAEPEVVPPPPDPPALAGGSKRALLQGVPVRRLGLPGALSVVLVLGLLLGLGRVLLAMAPARAQRS